MKTVFFSLTIVFLAAGACFSQTDSSAITKTDYRRAGSFLGRNIREKIYHLEVEPHWLKDSSGCWYMTNTPEGKTFYRVNFSRKTIEEAFDHKRLAQAVAAATGKEVKRKDLPFDHIEWENEGAIMFIIDHVKYRADLGNYHIRKLETLPDEDVKIRDAKSPDGKWIAFAKDYNLYIRPAPDSASAPDPASGPGLTPASDSASTSGTVLSQGTGAAPEPDSISATVSGSPSSNSANDIALSSDGREGYEYASYLGWGDIMEGEKGERPAHFTATWSPDASKILTQIVDLRQGNKMYLLNWSIDSMYRPKLLSYYRGSPGDTNIVYYIPVIFDVNTRKMVKIDLPPIPHFMGNPLRWSKDGSFLYGLYWHRGYKQMDVIRVDPATGKVAVKFSDSSETNVENITEFELLEEEGLAFITSERSGWNQLYRLNWADGRVERLTQGEFVVDEILEIDKERERVYFTAFAREEGRNPYFSHLYRIGFDGAGLHLLTPENAHHEVEIAPDNKYFIDNYSTATQPTVSILRRLSDGEIEMKLGKADITELLATGWEFPQVFRVKARDGKTDIYGALWKPSHFREDRKYPLIDNSYTGPQASVFPKSFSDAVFTSAQPLAEFGFVVMAVDGLGTAGRSKAFHDWSYKRLGFGLTDHVTAVRQLAEKYSWIDTNRVGIYGHSAGGYDAAHALMLFPHFYKVAVSSSGDHDHRMEKAWWPEMYMGWPVDSAYELQSNITMAHKMEGKLLLTHGGIDENVNPSATFKLAEALINAGKDFDMLIIPGSRHGYTAGYGEYFTRKRWNYFIEHLLGQKPVTDKSR